MRLAAQSLPRLRRGEALKDAARQQIGTEHLTRVNDLPPRTEQGMGRKKKSRRVNSGLGVEGQRHAIEG